MTSELKPCPKCLSDRVTCWNVTGGNQIVCKDCGLRNKPDEDETAVLNDWNTRATPDVPELETVALTDQDELDMCAEGYATSIWKAPIHDDGKPQIELVRKDQAAAMIADKVKIGEQVADKIFADYTTQLLLKEDAIKRAQYAETELAKSILKVNALETKLAQIKDQKPVGYFDGNVNFNSADADLLVITKDKGDYTHALYAAPVASEAETIERLRGALHKIAVASTTSYDEDVGTDVTVWMDEEDLQLIAVEALEDTALSGKEPS